MSDCEHSVETVMENLSVGDTVTIVDEYDIGRSREIDYFFNDDRYAQFGEPLTVPWVIDVKEAKFHEGSESGLGAGKDIVSIRFWDGEIDEDSGGDE